jgi:hypothetical protein
VVFPLNKLKNYGRLLEGMRLDLSGSSHSSMSQLTKLKAFIIDEVTKAVSGVLQQLGLTRLFRHHRPRLLQLGQCNHILQGLQYYKGRNVSILTKGTICIMPFPLNGQLMGVTVSPLTMSLWLPTGSPV